MTEDLNDVLLHYGVKGMKWKKNVEDDKDKKSTTDQQNKKDAKDLNELLLHYGIKGMRWGVSRRHKRASIKAFRAQGLSKTTSKSIYKTQTKALNKQLKKANELPDMVKKSNKKAVRVIRKDGKALEVSTNLLTKKRLFRQMHITGYQKHKLEAVLDTPIKEINRGSRKKVEKIMAKYKNLDVRVVTSDTMKDPNGGWVRLDVKKKINQSATNQDIITLQHYGVKGMRWGFRKSSRSSGVSKSKRDPLDNPIKRLKAEIASSKREASWSKKTTKDMSTKDLNRLTKRIQLENHLKTFAGNKKSQTRKDYLNRSEMSTKDLKTKVDRLQLEKNMKLASGAANKANRERAQAVVKSVQNVGTTYYTSKEPNLMKAINKEMTNIAVGKVSKKTKIPVEVLNSVLNKTKASYEDAKQASSPSDATSSTSGKSSTTTSKSSQSGSKPGKNTNATPTYGTDSSTKLALAAAKVRQKPYTGKVYSDLASAKRRRRP